MLALLWARPRSLPRECWLSTLGVLHPGVPVMWYGHIRDLSPKAVRLYGRLYAQCNKATLGTTEAMYWCHVSDGSVIGGWLGRVCTTLHLLHHTSLTAPAHLLFPSLPGPVVGEMLSAARFAAVGIVGRPFHVVRGVFCEGNEGIAKVREQHRYSPSASAVRECSGNVVGVHAVSLEIMQFVTSTIRTIYLPCVQCRGHCIGECCILASL